MRKLVLSLLAATALATAAVSTVSAADLPVRAAPPPVFAAVPVFTWTGFYVGGNLGWGWRDDDNETVVLTGPGVPGGLVGTLNFDNGNDGNFTGGGQIGYNYQIGSFVIGAEADIQAIATDDNDAVFVAGPGNAGVFVPGQFENNADWWGTVRLRAGVAFDRFLVYATGGLAYTEDNTGWTAGGGVEWALPVNVSLPRGDDEQDFFVARAKLNFKFGTY